MPMLRALCRAIRDGWLVLGLTGLGFLLLEAAYRAFGGGPDPRPWRADVDSAQHPYADAPWWPELRVEAELRPGRFDPYRTHWALAKASRYVNVDSAGRRLTAQAAPSRASLRVLALGGSTMWGYTARDSQTIPSLLGEALSARGISDVEVLNLAQPAFNSMQQLNTLVLEVAGSGPPTVAIVLDGYNDIATGLRHGEPGHTYGETSVQQHVDIGRRGLLGQLVALGRHSAIIRRLRAAMDRSDRERTARPDRVCGAIAGHYRSIAKVGAAVGNEFGFSLFHFLQPVHAASRKPRSGWERALPENAGLRQCLSSIDSAMAEPTGGTYHSLLSLFDGDTATVFVDEHAHLTEAANRRVAERIADLIVPVLDRARTQLAAR
jgi:lysophospholipase L1-like esterase